MAKKNEKIVRPSVRSVVRSSVRSFVRPFVRSFVRSSVRECARIAKTRKKRRKRRKKRKNRSASKMKDRVVTIHFVQFSSKSELSSGGKRPFKVFSFSHFFWPQAVNSSENTTKLNLKSLQQMQTTQISVRLFREKSEHFRKCPNASERAQTHPNASERIP